MDAPLQANDIIIQKLLDFDIRLNQIYRSVESTRRYFLATFILSLLMLVLPLIGMAIVAPMLLNMLGSAKLPTDLYNLKGLGL
jgi:hypothetical protein